MKHGRESDDLVEVAALELNALAFAGVWPEGGLEGTRLRSTATPIYDVGGDLLFLRVPFGGGRAEGYVDVAASAAFAQPIVAVAFGREWSERGVLAEAREHARRHRKKLEGTDVRIVAYSYPKLAVQFLDRGEEVLMLELASWAPVPAAPARRKDTPPGNFERWSLLGRTDPKRRAANQRALKKRLAAWKVVCPPDRRRRFRPELLRPKEFGATFHVPVPTVTTRDLHYSRNNADHTPCYELRGQLTNVWCVAASVEMVLDFYRYHYDQTRVAAELGLGTLASPTGLPYTRDGDVVTVLETLSSQALGASMTSVPFWNQFVQEIDANRPLVSFIPGHSRSVAGYTETTLWPFFIFRGLLVYDPWPPATGVITRWENFDNQTYRRTFTAQVTLV